jgi:multidrug resistance efflux pump
LKPTETGVVRSIRVHDGQAVRAGDVLIELDPTANAADRDHLQGDLLAEQLKRNWASRKAMRAKLTRQLPRSEKRAARRRPNIGARSPTNSPSRNKRRSGSSRS